MKVIIAGGRNYLLNRSDELKLDAIHEDWGITEVVSGGARGVDACGERWAKDRKIPVKVFEADWEKHGRRAGPIRNRDMAKYADAVVLFHGGKGTQSMYLEAKALGLTIVDYRTSNEGEQSD
jgi:hypothetical protein